MSREAGPVLLATKNRHKAEELTALLGAVSNGIKALNLAEWEAANRSLPEPDEGADSFSGNAVLKARFYAGATGLVALADDSGLSVEALGGAPGVLSARYGGPGLDDQGRLELLLRNMEGLHDRRAFFTSVLALARPDGRALYWAGRADGLISREPRGANGFGYDPIFYYPPGRRTMAEMSAEEKNLISHRARAAALFLDDASRVRRFLHA
ncbi:RdgB/HAM1 family non-canonical purine NTP pyrophosphatase [Deltaproteobacteria bacterium OttesenSCG-928-K17]|nr:RdgB/HAM1 family non-canonical purine NTP pyrophosphatase [Deltaproteobacteria bacterium OttesenSCG-928-K17]